MPSDFKAIIDAGATDAISADVRLTDLGEVRQRQATPTIASGTYWVAVEYPGQSVTTTNAPVARLAIYPTPSSSSAGAVELIYRAGWTTLAEGSSVSNIPEAYERLLAQAIRAFALGLVDESNGTVQKRLEELDQSAFFRQLKESDGMAQPQMGQMHGGHIAAAGSSIYRPYSSITKS